MLLNIPVLYEKFQEDKLIQSSYIIICIKEYCISWYFCEEKYKFIIATCNIFCTHFPPFFRSWTSLKRYRSCIVIYFNIFFLLKSLIILIVLHILNFIVSFLCKKLQPFANNLQWSEDLSCCYKFNTQYTRW